MPHHQGLPIPSQRQTGSALLLHDGAVAHQALRRFCIFLVTHPSPSLAAGRVVYIEDDVVTVALFEAIVETHYPGIELIHACTAAAGISAVRAQRPDLVLLDMWLPDSSGADVVRELNFEISTGGLQVVLLTAAHMSPDVIKALALGAVECWSKPMDLSVLRAGLERRLMGPKHAARPSFSSRNGP